MRRRIVTLAALTLSLSAIGIAPLTAQASPTVTSGSISITAGLESSVDVTSMPASLDLGATIDPEVGVSGADFSFNVAFNGGGYKVTFTSAHPSGSSAFQLVKSATTDYVPYTILGHNANDLGFSYVSGTAGATLTEGAPDFKFNVAPITLSTTLPSGAYADSLTVAVTAQ